MAQRERQALVEEMKRTGPDAPTLCGDWTVRDLAAHLVVRERRLDAAPGIMLSSFAPRLKRVQDQIAAQPFEQLLEQVRTGPPVWSLFRPIDAFVNLNEMFVHHEDVRRAAPGWEPRELAPEDQAKLWSATTRMARMSYRKCDVPVRLENLAGESVCIPAKSEPQVTIVGAPAEHALFASGRDQVRLEFRGEPEAVQAVRDSNRSI